MAPSFTDVNRGRGALGQFAVFEHDGFEGTRVGAELLQKDVCQQGRGFDVAPRPADIRRRHRRHALLEQRWRQRRKPVQ